MKRIPVEWQNITIKKGEDQDGKVFGCIVGANDKVQAQGSDASVLSDDLNKQFTALAAWLNTPGSFTGTFGEAIEETKRLAQMLLDKIASGQVPTAEEIGKYKSVCKALKNGMETWKGDIQRKFPNPTPEVTQVIRDIDSYTPQLLDLIGCNPTGFRYSNEERLQKGGPNMVESINVIACNYNAGKEAALKLEKDIELLTQNFLWETDGHFSTIYLVSLMLGMDKEKAKELAIYTEAPDNDVHEEWQAEMQATWAYPWQQEATHALTGTFHSEEEFATCVTFLNLGIGSSTFMNNSIFSSIIKTQDDFMKELGRLLHRYGDCYAHTRLADDNKRINERTMYGKKFTFNYYYTEGMNSYSFPVETPITFEHMSADGGRPDRIGERPDWYLKYVQNLSSMLSVKFNLSDAGLNLGLFQKLAYYARDNNDLLGNKVSLIGIMNYEVAVQLGKKDFIIPVFEPSLNIIAYAAAIKDYIDNGVIKGTYFNYVENTKKYLVANNVSFRIVPVFVGAEPKGIKFILL